MRKPIFIGNWKMNMTVPETIRMVTELKGRLSGKQDVEIVIAPPFVSIHPAEIAAQDTPILIAGQNCHFEERGAFTGEISCGMLTDAGCKYVILGHSERRRLFGEDDALINRKIRAALDHELTVIYCVGETKEERQKGTTFDVIESQLRVGLRGVMDAECEKLIVAYEPVWAIGTGDTASPGIAQEVHFFIREKLAALFRRDIAEKIRIIYGGSVDPENIHDLMDQKDIDGALVGGASLDPEKFVKIIHHGE